MLRPFAILLLLYAISISAEDDCTFSEEAQLKAVQEVASRFPGGLIDTHALSVTWILENHDSDTFAHGGCYDLGTVVTRESRLSEKRTQKQVLDTALELGRKYLSDVELRILEEAVPKSKFSVERFGPKTFYWIHDSRYVEFYIEHEYAGDADRVTVALQYML